MPTCPTNLSGAIGVKPSLLFLFLGLGPRSLSDFGAGFGPKGFGNSAQALAWVGVIFYALAL